MWTCPKCSEEIEDQFDSCWKCAGQAEKTVRTSQVQTLNWFHYLIAAVISYLIPWLAVFLHDFLVWSRTLHHAMHAPGRNLPSLEAYLWMALPGAITFLILFPFLKRRTHRRIICGCLFVGWFITVAYLS